MDLRRILGGLTITALSSAFIYALLAAYADVAALLASLGRFSAGSIAAMLGLTLAGYGLRAIRWRYLASRLGHRIRIADALYIQFSTITMTVTPGKVGEVLKAYLGREIAGIPISRGLGFVFSERLADLIAVLVLSVGGVSALHGGPFPLLVAALVVAAGTFVAGSERFHARALRVVQGRTWAKRHHASAEEISKSIRATLRAVPLTASIALAAGSWALEGLAFALALEQLGFDGLGLGSAIAVYAISTIVGALAFLPGGVGLTEVSMVGLLVAAGMPRADASAATLMIRIVTLWFGVALGWGVFATRPAVLRGFLASRGDDARSASASDTPRAASADDAE